MDNLLPDFLYYNHQKRHLESQLWILWKSHYIWSFKPKYSLKTEVHGVKHFLVIRKTCSLKWTVRMSFEAIWWRNMVVLAFMFDNAKNQWARTRLNLDVWMDLQEREIVKECTGGGPVGEPPILKSNYCYLSSDISYKNIEVRKRKCTLTEGVLCFI